MGFLFPLYLLGALAIGIPVLLHLRRRQTRERMDFSSLMFLEADPPAKRTRSRLEQLALLALRSLAIMVVALLFARPLRPDPAAFGKLAQGVRRVLLIDHSASMRREGILEPARKAIAAELARCKPEDELAILGFSESTTVLLSFDEWRRWPEDSRVAQAEYRATAREPGWKGTNLGAALVDALGMLGAETSAQAGQRAAEVVVVSDWQSGASLAAVEGFSWPGAVSLRRVELRAQFGERSNASVHLAGAGREQGSERDAAMAASSKLVKVRVTNAPGSEVNRFRLAWSAGSAGDKPASGGVDVILPAGSSRVVTAPPRTSGQVSLVLTGDREPFDNRVFVAPNQALPVRVLYAAGTVDDNNPGEPLFYLSRALQDTDMLAPILTSRSLEVLTGEELQAEDVLVLADEPAEPMRELIERFLEGGGVVWLPLKDGMNPARLPVLSKWGVSFREAKPANFALWSGLDFQHPLLKPFAPAALRDFSKIHVWRHRGLVFPGAVPEGVAIPARFDDGGAALLVARVGKGELIAFPGGWLPADSQLALSSKFVPLVYAMLREAGYDAAARRQFAVGDELPDGTVAQEPGIVAASGLGARRSGPWAVNMPVAESNLEPLAEGELARLGLPVSRKTPEGAPASSAGEEREHRKRLHFAELEERQRIWRWLALAALLILLGETWLSSRRVAARVG